MGTHHLNLRRIYRLEKIIRNVGEEKEISDVSLISVSLISARFLQKKAGSCSEGLLFKLMESGKSTKVLIMAGRDAYVMTGASGMRSPLRNPLKNQIYSLAISHQMKT